jgi:hypothetical protein
MLTKWEQAGFRLANVRWPGLEVAWGQLQVLGYLPFLVRTGDENLPRNAESVYPDDIYAVYAWPRNRIVIGSDSASQNFKTQNSQAHDLAQLYVFGLTSAVKAAAIVNGDSVGFQGKPDIDSFDSEEGYGLFGMFPNEFNSAKADAPARRAAWIEGIQNGLSFVRQAQEFGGRSMLDASQGPAVARLIAEWSPDFATPWVVVESEGSTLKFTDLGARASVYVSLSVKQ